MKRIGITLGDPNGISPEIIIKALNFLDLPADKITIIGNKNIFDFYKEKLGLSMEKDYPILEIPYKNEDIMVGQETAAGGEFAFRSIVQVCNLAINNEIDAIITAPVSKNAMKIAGHNYSGQTEIIEQYIAQSNQKAEMLFFCNKFSVLLLTRHIAIKDVPQYIKKETIIEKIQKLETSLQIQLGISNPKIGICALNPHAGENGMFGDEEINEIIPAVKKLQSMGINIEGPFSADTLFTACNTQDCKYDCYVAMYHDQGLIPIKILERDNCVNTTIGLNILRTSPAHGTAFNIAGKNIANPNSMIQAIELALR